MCVAQGADHGECGSLGQVVRHTRLAVGKVHEQQTTDQRRLYWRLVFALMQKNSWSLQLEHTQDTESHAFWT